MKRKEKKRPQRNAIAKDLRTPKYKMQVQKDRKRKLILKQIDKILMDAMKGFE